MRSAKKRQSGFTLLEIIMTMLVGAIIIPPIILMIVTALRAPTVMSGTIKGNSLASDMMEEILSKSWDENSTDTGPIADGIKTLPANLGPDGGETRPSFNDVDDYNGYSESPPTDHQGQVITEFSDFTRSVQIFYVQGGASEDYDTELGAVSNFKKIIITVESKVSKNEVEAVVSNR